MKKYEMIIFDVDGTICDTVDIVYESINTILKNKGIDRKVKLKDIKMSQGLNKVNFAEKCMSFLDKELREKYERISESSLNVYPNVKETIEELSKKYLISIASNCGHGYIETILPKIEIKDYVDDYIAASALNISKADAIKEIMKRNNVKKAIYVGDTLLDKKSSLEANTVFIFAEYGFGNISDVKYNIKSFNELPKIINKIENDT